MPAPRCLCGKCKLCRQRLSQQKCRGSKLLEWQPEPAEPDPAPIGLSCRALDAYALEFAPMKYDFDREERIRKQRGRTW